MAEEIVVRDLVDQATELAEAGEWSKLTALVASLHPADLAELLFLLEEEHRRELIRQLPSDIVGQLFEYVRDEERRELIDDVGVEQLPALLDETPDDVIVDILQELEPGQQIETLKALDRGEEVAELLEYGTESAGGIMSRGFISLNQEMETGHAIEFLRVLRPPSDRAYYLYVVDDDNRLQGVVSLRDLIVASPGTKLAEITQRDVHAVTPETDQEEAARILQRYNLLAVPVVDDEGRLQGVMTADDLMDVLSEEATEDMYRMVGIDTQESVFSPVGRSVRRRVPWLLINLMTAFIASLTVSLFEDTISRVALLAAFMPVIAGHGGNTGTQAVTIVVRGIALGEIENRDATKILLKEVAFGLIHGSITGILTGTLAFILSGNVWLAAIVFVAMLGNVVIAGVAGALIPLGLRKLRVDPALASSIWLTTFTDVLGFLMLLGFGTILIDRIG
ncbi:MAG: magnesium transporter [Dehalococcoidia bacterium]